MKITKVINDCYQCEFFRNVGIPYTEFSNKKCTLLHKDINSRQSFRPDCPLPEYNGPPLKTLGKVKNENAI